MRSSSNFAHKRSCIVCQALQRRAYAVRGGFLLPNFRSFGRIKVRTTPPDDRLVADGRARPMRILSVLVVETSRLIDDTLASNGANLVCPIPSQD